MNRGFKTGLFGFKKKQVIEYLSEQKSEHNSLMSAASKDTDRLVGINNELERNIAALTRQTDELAAERAALIAQKDEISGSLQQKEAEADALRAELDERRSSCDSLKTALAAQIDECTVLKNEHTALQAEHQKCLMQAGENAITSEREKAQLNAQLSEREERIKALEEENAQLRRQLERKQLTAGIKADPVRAILSYVKKNKKGE
ncbi:MAG: hypothetical protein J6V15_05345 [Clostridia bacterium]|nr:hypothetical protein [Clostridia bacterium]